MSEARAAYRVAGRGSGALRVDEHTEQANFFSEVSLRYFSRPDFLPVLLFAVPNGAVLGGQNRFAMFQKLKAEGFKSGVADVLYLQPRGGYAFLALEFKAQDQRGRANGGMSPEQAAFLEEVNGAGGLGEAVYGAEDAMRIFDLYMGFDNGPI